MAHELEYIVKDALMMCDKGAAPGFFRPLHNMTTKINGCLVTTKMDKLPIVNIPSFGICSLTQKPCIPVPTEWQKTYKAKVKGAETLLFRSCMQCSIGGKIEFVTSGQIPLPPDALEDIQKMQEEGAKEEEEGFGWLDAVEMVPVVGSIVGMVREAKKGNWGMAILNLGFLVADVAGVISFGATTAASTAGKAAVKTGVKVAAKSASKQAAKQVGKTGLKTGTKLTAKGAGKAFKSEIKGIVQKTGKGKKPVTSKKPKYSPDPKKWKEKGGKVEKLDDGTWRYTDWEGNVVDYKNGHPDFGKYSRQDIDIGKQKGNHTTDYSNAEKASKLKPPKEDGTSWHHHEDGKTMQEIPTDIHKRFTHEGGVSGMKKSGSVAFGKK
jgi:hypothetical protein